MQYEETAGALLLVGLLISSSTSVDRVMLIDKSSSPSVALSVQLRAVSIILVHGPTKCKGSLTSSSLLSDDDPMKEDGS
jgi:hypothetical protein